MQRRPTVGPGSRWPPFGNVSPEQFQKWARVRHSSGKGGKDGEWRVGVGMCRGAVVRGKGRGGKGWGVDYLGLASASTYRHYVMNLKRMKVL